MCCVWACRFHVLLVRGWWELARYVCRVWWTVLLYSRHFFFLALGVTDVVLFGGRGGDMGGWSYLSHGHSPGGLFWWMGGGGG